MRFALLLIVCCAALHAESVKDNDKIVFFGDSITAQSGKAGGFFTLIKEALNAKHPDAKLEFVNAGISGHQVTNLMKRVDKDVIDRKPTLVIIYIGINDVWHRKTLEEVQSNLENYRTVYKELIGRIQAAGARTMLCTPSVIGEKKVNDAKNDTGLEAYSEVVRALAKETKSTLIDLRAAFKAHLAEHNAADAPKGILTGDGVHLNPAGNRLVAEQVCKALGEALPPAAPVGKK